MYTPLILLYGRCLGGYIEGAWMGANLTHWGRVTHVYASKLPIIGSDIGLSPGRRQAIIWTNAGILLIWPLWTNFNKTLIEIGIFSFKKMRLKESSTKWRSCCLGLNVFICRRRLTNYKVEKLVRTFRLESLYWQGYIFILNWQQPPPTHPTPDLYLRFDTDRSDLYAFERWCHNGFLPSYDGLVLAIYRYMAI